VLNGLMKNNPATSKKRFAAWYPLHREQVVSNSKARRHELRDWYNNLRSSLQCERCGESHIACLDFHHISGKDRAVSSMVVQGYSKKRILAEISKCVVLCSNCHRKEHWTSSTLVDAGIL
jgi:L-lysine 2,3-aminomutase